MLRGGSITSQKSIYHFERWERAGIAYNPKMQMWIERLANEGYIINIEYSKRLVRITCEGNALRTLIPFGQTRLNKWVTLAAKLQINTKFIHNLLVYPQNQEN